MNSLRNFAEKIKNELKVFKISVELIFQCDGQGFNVFLEGLRSGVILLSQAQKRTACFVS